MAINLKNNSNDEEINELVYQQGVYVVLKTWEELEEHYPSFLDDENGLVIEILHEAHTIVKNWEYDKLGGIVRIDKIHISNDYYDIESDMIFCNFMIKRVCNKIQDPELWI